MKKLLYFLLAALMVLAAVSCDKKDPNNNGNGNGNGNEQEDIVLPDVISDLVVGDVSIPIKTLTSRHAAVFAAYDGWEDQVFYAEDINELKFVTTSEGGWEYHALCVPLGDKSLQDIYDLVDDKASYALFVITDKKLDAGQYSFMDDIPVGILPVSAVETIEGALYKYEETGMDSFNIMYKTREDLLLPAKPIVGKQWLCMMAGFWQSFIYDIGYTAKDYWLWWGNAQGMLSGFIAYGIPIEYFAFRQPVLPHRIINKGGNVAEFQSDESGLEVSMVRSDGKTLVLESLWSFGEHVYVRAYTYSTDSDASAGNYYIFSPINPPLKGSAYLYDLMITVEGEDYPMKCYGESDHTDMFLAMKQNVPFVYLDALGYPEDFQNVDVSGKLVGLNRGTITFSEKQANAKNAGAIGVICVNNQADDNNRPSVDAESIPFGIVKMNMKDILKSCTSISFTEAHD